jgi:hypothetical protein
LVVNKQQLKPSTSLRGNGLARWLVTCSRRPFGIVDLLFGLAPVCELLFIMNDSSSSPHRATHILMITGIEYKLARYPSVFG